MYEFARAQRTILDLEDSHEFREEIRIARIECCGETNGAANNCPAKLT
jgi:hypothetical protein